MNLLQSERMAELFCKSLFTYRAEGKVRVHAFVVMPNHVHLLISVVTGSTLERTMQLIKGKFSREAGKLLQLNHPFWQKSFVDRRVRNAEECRSFLNYIHQNPVVGRLAESPAAYPYSSANPCFVTDEIPQRLKPALIEADAMYR